MTLAPVSIDSRGAYPALMPIEPGDYGDVVLELSSGGRLVVEYDDDEWGCFCHESSKCQGSCTEGDPCERCGCEVVAVCYRPGIDPGTELAAAVPFSELEEAGELRRRVALISGPCIYVAQLMPDLAPQRLKVGYSLDVRARLRAYRTASPPAQIIAVRPGDLAAEAAVLLRFRRQFRHVGGEVFDVASVDAALALFNGEHE